MSEPHTFRWGETAICPRCRSKTTRGHKRKEVDETVPEHVRQRKSKARAKSGPSLVSDDGILLFRDPFSRIPKPCARCNGYGIVPNVGPIPMTPPDGAKP